jgi:hypothetical protein
VIGMRHVATFRRDLFWLQSRGRYVNKMRAIRSVVRLITRSIDTHQSVVVYLPSFASHQQQNLVI